MKSETKESNERVAGILLGLLFAICINVNGDEHSFLEDHIQVLGEFLQLNLILREKYSFLQDSERAKVESKWFDKVASVSSFYHELTESEKKAFTVCLVEFGGKMIRNRGIRTPEKLISPKIHGKSTTILVIVRGKKL
jgi:hypothetical protein